MNKIKNTPFYYTPKIINIEKNLGKFFETPFLQNCIEPKAKKCLSTAIQKKWTLKKTFFGTLQSGVLVKIFEFLQNGKMSLICQTWTYFNETIVKKNELKKLIKNTFIRFQFKQIIKENEKCDTYRKISIIQKIPKEIIRQFKYCHPQAWGKPKPLKKIHKIYSKGSFSHKKILEIERKIQDKSLIEFWEKVDLSLRHFQQIPDLNTALKRLKEFRKNKGNERLFTCPTGHPSSPLPLYPPRVSRF